MGSVCLCKGELLAKAGVVRGRGCWVFFFQAEDGIRDVAVTGVQTCALPIFEKPDGIAISALFILETSETTMIPRMNRAEMAMPSGFSMTFSTRAYSSTSVSTTKDRKSVV